MFGSEPSLVNLTSRPGKSTFTFRVSFIMIAPGLGKWYLTPPNKELVIGKIRCPKLLEKIFHE